MSAALPVPNPRFACESIAVRITAKRIASLLEVKRVLLQRIKRNHGERLLVRRREHDGCRDTSCERFAPGGGAYAPSIARLETGKTEFWRGRNEVIAALTRKREKLLGYLHANDMQPKILGSGVAAAVAIKPGAR
jgi:hypothetical protein